MTRTRIRAGRIRPSLKTTTLLVLSAGLIAGCGSVDNYANEPRPPAPINVTANISDARVDVSPRTFGAGPIVLLIANQSSKSQEVTLETSEIGGEGPGIEQTTSPINPGGTAELKVDIKEGSYRLSVDSTKVRPASVKVSEPRESAQNELLQP